MTTKISSTGRALVAILALATGLGAALPAEAAMHSDLKEVTEPGSRDCLSRQEVKHEFQTLLTHVNVSRTNEPYVYLVTGDARHPAKEMVESNAPQSQMLKDSSHEKLRYIFTYDACTQRVVHQISPQQEM